MPLTPTAALGELANKLDALIELQQQTISKLDALGALVKQNFEASRELLTEARRNAAANTPTNEP